MATKKLSAKAFFADIKEEPDATRSTRPSTVSEKSVESPAGKEQKREDAFRTEHAHYLEKGAEEEHMDAKMGVGGFPKHPVSYEEAKDMHSKTEPLYREAAKDEIHRTTMGKVADKKIKEERDNAHREYESRQKAEKFAQNVEKYGGKAEEPRMKMTRKTYPLPPFDSMDTKKNPTGWAKEFFRDLHDKK